MYQNYETKIYQCHQGGLLYTALGISFLYLLITGQYKLYVAPRYVLFLLLAGIALLLGGIISLCPLINNMSH